MVTKYILSQQQFQQQVLTDLSLDPSTASPLYVVWFNPTNPHSLRLTKLGHHWFSKTAGLPHFSVDLGDHRIYPRQLLQLERLFQAPYYIQTVTRLVVYGESDYVMLQLHAGDLPLYLNNMESHGD